jgi:hypothetical protein
MLNNLNNNGKTFNRRFTFLVAIGFCSLFASLKLAFDIGYEEELAGIDSALEAPVNATPAEISNHTQKSESILEQIVDAGGQTNESTIEQTVSETQTIETTNLRYIVDQNNDNHTQKSEIILGQIVDAGGQTNESTIERTVDETKTIESANLRYIVDQNNETRAKGLKFWELPTSNNRNILSEAGNWAWEFPEFPDPITREGYMRDRYLPEEIECSTFCCVGATYTGRGAGPSSCRKHMDFMVEFTPLKPKRRKLLYSLVDTILLFQREQLSPSFLFIGDSVQGQIFHAAICELKRNDFVDEITYMRSDRAIGDYELLQAKIRLKSTAENLTTNATLVFVKTYKIPPSVFFMQELFSSFDMLIFGWGLHYDDDAVYATDLTYLFDTIKTTRANQTLLWVGAPHQHFRYDVADYNSSGIYDHTKPKAGGSEHPWSFCGNTLKQSTDSEQFDHRNKFVFQLARHHNISSSWFNWSGEKPRETGSQHLYFFPTEEWTAPFYKNHQGYEDLPNKQNSPDCTHPCLAPNMIEPLWDCFYLISNTRADTTTRLYPSFGSPGSRGFIRNITEFPRLITISRDRVSFADENMLNDFERLLHIHG